MFSKALLFPIDTTNTTNDLRNLNWKREKDMKEGEREIVMVYSFLHKTLKLQVQLKKRNKKQWLWWNQKVFETSMVQEIGFETLKFFFILFLQWKSKIKKNIQEKKHYHFLHRDRDCNKKFSYRALEICLNFMHTIL
jgi:hypothetical protein